MTGHHSECDVLIVGGGMAGLTAAIAAGSAGARTVVLEARGGTGGNAALSAGMFLGSGDVEGLHAYIPDGDLMLQDMLCREFQPSLKWLESLGMPLAEPFGFGDFRIVRPMGIGQPGNRRAWMDSYCQKALDVGVTVRAPCAMVALAQGDKTLEVETVEGERLTAPAVILATGGFQGDRDRLRGILGAEAADALFLRSLPEARGDGLRVAEALGATTAGHLDAFYGHTLLDLPLGPGDWQRLTPYFSRGSILVNRDGRRFTDEAAGLLEETNPQDGCRQPGGLYWLVFDRGVLDDADEIQGTASTLGDFDWVAEARAVGADVHERATLDSLANDLAADGVDRSGFLETVAAYNRACRENRAASLDPPHSAPYRPLASPPYFGVRCRAAITGTTGGIAIGEDCGVRRADGSTVPGLFAAGVDAGGYFGRTYNGFLGWSLVSGRMAGASAAAMANLNRRR